MKILLVNNQLSILGGSETYMFSIGEELSNRGHDVQYFGVRDVKSIHGNKYNIYAKKSRNPLKQISNSRNARLFGKLLDLFKPDIVHINLMYFTLTPKIVEESFKRGIPMIQTVHDSKIVCPNHRLYIPQLERPCIKCLDEGFKCAVKNKCVKKSSLLSYIAAKETKYYLKNGIYNKIDKFIFPSLFMEKIHVKHGVDERQSIVLHNFSRIIKTNNSCKDKANDKYVLYFGRVSTEKGVELLAEVAKNTPDINYVIAGTGEKIAVFRSLSNCKCIGQKSGLELETIISKATFTVFPSIWYENCPMSILESIALGTPVLGANIGGIPELLVNGKTGLLFEPSSVRELEQKITELYYDEEKTLCMSKECLNDKSLLNVFDYVDKLLIIYSEVMKK